MELTEILKQIEPLVEALRLFHQKGGQFKNYLNDKQLIAVEKMYRIVSKQPAYSLDMTCDRCILKALNTLFSYHERESKNVPISTEMTTEIQVESPPVQKRKTGKNRKTS